MAKKERNPNPTHELWEVWQQLPPEQQLPLFISLLKDLLHRDQTGWLHDLLILLTTDFDPPDEK